MISIARLKSVKELEKITTKNMLAEKLHEMLIPFEDTIPEIKSGLDYALDTSGHRGGFILIALDEGDIAGALVMLKTNMSGYVPENLLLYVAVDSGKRGKGIGSKLIKEALDLCSGDVKLHVEYDNPAKGLYQRLGFQSKYADMRYSNE